jgi:hypothetical protein
VAGLLNHESLNRWTKRQSFLNMLSFLVYSSVLVECSWSQIYMWSDHAIYNWQYAVVMTHELASYWLKTLDDTAFMAKHASYILESISICYLYRYMYAINTGRCSVVDSSPRTDTLTVRNEEAITWLNLAN